MKSFFVINLLIAIALAAPNVNFDRYSIENRIAGGNTANPTQIPYQVGLDITKFWGTAGEWDEWCGGSLISDQLVITAAHCLRRAIKADVYLGTTDLSKDDEPGQVVIKVKTENFIIHEEYNHYLLRNDIALIKLPQKVKLSKHIQTVNLPRRSQRNSNFVNSMGIISGWGLTGQDEDQPDLLQYAPRMILPDENCEAVFQLFKKDTQICVDGSRGISSCPGDSGGPMAIKDTDGTNTLIGLVSYGRPRGCGKGFPSAYTRITAFLDWIELRGGVQLRK